MINIIILLIGALLIWMAATGRIENFWNALTLGPKA